MTFKITIIVQRGKKIYESDEGTCWEDIPEILKTVKTLVNQDINKENNESN